VITKLNLSQKNHLKIIFRLAHTLQDARDAVNGRLREARARLAQTKTRLQREQASLATAEGTWSGIGPYAPDYDAQGRENRLTGLREKVRDLTENVSVLTTSAAELEREVEALTPDVTAASRLADALVAHVGVSSEDFEPVLRSGVQHDFLGKKLEAQHG
jgi:chromosome segregation ATPase